MTDYTTLFNNFLESKWKLTDQLVNEYIFDDEIMSADRDIDIAIGKLYTVLSRKGLIRDSDLQ